MNVEYPDDLGGRELNCIARAKLIAETLYALGHGIDDIGPPSGDALMSLSAIAKELAEELEGIHEKNIDVANRLYELEHAGSGASRTT